ncbi:phosphatase PAP2 family protein [Nonomuraea sp. NPDC050536]|uniref:phosphatase PAP2 family protein n=1 Tax=Nonomuraea sp. NPDC050536 TaxID=3364366 RepID=UPI0037C7F662
MDLLDGLHLAELGPIRWLQGLPGALLPVMQAFSAFGTDTFFLLVLPVLYWCVSPRLGLRLGLTVLAAAGTNALLKLAFHQPRPYWIDPGIRPLAVENTFGLPSGHAQVAAASWGQVARLAGRPWAWWAAGVLTFLIGLSRVYLGVHFASDVVAGFALGLAVLLLAVKLEEPATAWWLRRPLWAQLAASAVPAAVLIGLGLIGHPAQESLGTVVAMAGGLLGTLAGASVMNRLGWFDAGGPLRLRVARWFVGSVVAGLLWYVTRHVTSEVTQFARYAVIALWVQAGAPVTFIRLGLMARRAVH